jgi:antirestriction protein
MSTIDERLERVAALVESNTEHLAALHTITQIQSEHITNLRIAQQQYQQNFEVVHNEIRRISEDVRGLQTENRRILDHLFGQTGDA